MKQFLFTGKRNRACDCQTMVILSYEKYRYTYIVPLVEIILRERSFFIEIELLLVKTYLYK